MPLLLLLLLLCTPCLSCHSDLPPPAAIVRADTIKPAPVATGFTFPPGADLESRFPAPGDFVRIPVPEGSFPAFLRRLPLKADGMPVLYFHGGEKADDGTYVAVIDWSLDDRDLQQCADAVIRLRAEYLYQKGRYDEIHFNFSNGFRAEYTTWRSGMRIAVDGKEVTWRHTSAPSDTEKSFREYLRMVYAYANSASLERELRPVDLRDMMIGDVFIQGGYPGHAAIVVDMAAHPDTGEKIFLLAQSFMPAQDIHVLDNLQGQGLGPWYRLDTAQTAIHTPSWTFQATQLRRF